MFSFLGSSLFKYFVVGLLIISVVGGFYKWLESKDAKIQELNNQIEDRNEIIASKEIDIQKLRIANDSISKELIRKAQEADAIKKELEILQKIDSKSQESLKELETKLNNLERLSRIESIKTEKGELLVRLRNNAVKCEIENFGKVGKCIGGSWRGE